MGVSIGEVATVVGRKKGGASVVAMEVGGASLVVLGIAALSVVTLAVDATPSVELLLVEVEASVVGFRVGVVTSFVTLGVSVVWLWVVDGSGRGGGSSILKVRPSYMTKEK